MSEDPQQGPAKNRDHNPLRQDAAEERERFRKRGRFFKRLAMLFLVPAVACFVAAVVVPIVIVAMNGGESDGRLFEYMGPLLAVPGVLLLIRSRKYRTLSANEVLENDPRPPVIYLRSFKDDRGAGRPLGIMRFSNFKYFWHLIFAFYNVPHEFMGWSEEEILTQVLGTIGPVVAIGRPGEKLPQLGAARVYVEDADWQQKVHELLAKAALVVLRLGKTEGFWWEVEQSASRLDPRRLVFLVPLGRKQYDEFRKRAEKYFPKGLPDYSSSPLRRIFGKRVDGKVRGLIYFESDWTPVFVNLYKVRWQWDYKFHMMSRHYLANIYDWALGPVFVQLCAEWKPPSRRPLMIAFKSLGYVLSSAICLGLFGGLLVLSYAFTTETLFPSPSTLDNQLIEAAYSGDAPKVEKLLDRGATVDAKNATGDDQHEEPLIEAAERGNLEAARVLLDHGAKPTGVNPDGWTALAHAADRNDAAMIRLLLAHGANADEHDPLLDAIRNRNVDAVRALLDGGASCEYEDRFGNVVPVLTEPSVNDTTWGDQSARKEVVRLLKTKCKR